jgi:hypothetical protein
VRSIIAGEVIAFVGALFLNCAPAAAVIGGDLADVTLRRYTVAVRSTKGLCTGVVLAQDIVLTAAHCTQDAQNVWVGGNEGWRDAFGYPVGLSRVAQIVQHPSYSPGQARSCDLALLKLAKPLPDRFLAASPGARFPKQGDGVITTGYGESMENDPSVGTVLRMVLLRVSHVHANYLDLVSAREGPAGSGRGDSGGPVFTYHGLNALVEIIVGHRGGETTAVPIAPNYLWIKETMEKLGST